jgi:hypothetical protein
MDDNQTIDFECAHCRQRLRVPGDAAGKRIRCPECNAVVEVPGQTGITEEAPRPQSPAPKRETDPDEERDRDRDYDDDYSHDLPVRRRASVGGSVIGPAIFMLIVAGIALVLDLFNAVVAIAVPVPAVDPQQPPFLQEMMKSTRGPVAAATQGGLALVAVITILGSIQMLRQKTWGLCLTASILSMIHFGSCCCLLGLPAGIWALISLVNADVKNSFS